MTQQLLLDVSHQPFPKLMHDTVLAPIGMTRSTYEQPLPTELRSGAATPYKANGDPVQGGFHIYPEMAAAGLWTTPTDLARYAIEPALSRRARQLSIANPDDVEVERQLNARYGQIEIISRAALALELADRSGDNPLSAGPLMVSTRSSCLASTAEARALEHLAQP